MSKEDSFIPLVVASFLFGFVLLDSMKGNNIDKDVSDILKLRDKMSNNGRKNEK